MDRIHAPIRPLDVTSADGTRLRAYTCGTGPHRWVLTPGLGTPLLCWKYLLETFHEQMTILTWEPRGCYGSEAPRDLARLHVEDHVQDGLAVLRAAGWEQGPWVLGGWSMGIEIALEMYALLPEQVQALVLINGAFEHVLETAFSALPSRVLPRVAHLAGKAAALANPAIHYALGQDWAIAILKRLRIVTHNNEFFGEVAREFRELDFGVYFPMMLQLNEHSARHLLPTVRVPTLVTAGTADMMTPLAVARHMHEQIAGSEFFVVPNGTHYTTLEYPEIVHLKLEQFFRRRVFGAAWDGVAPRAKGRKKAAVTA